MTKEKLAEIINGREYGNETSKDILDIAKQYGLVIVTGASDDLIEFYGAINDEGSGLAEQILINRDGILNIDPDDVEVLERYDVLETIQNKYKVIIPIWNDSGNPCWTYKTEIPHATFNIYEDGDIYCVGMVISIEDI